MEFPFETFSEREHEVFAALIALKNDLNSVIAIHARHCDVIAIIHSKKLRAWFHTLQARLARRDPVSRVHDYRQLHKEFTDKYIDMHVAFTFNGYPDEPRGERNHVLLRFRELFAQTIL